jgi:hypothetical protein
MLLAQQIHLNHAFITPDAATYEAIRNSPFVKQFAVWEERTTHRKDITYTGFYLYGQHTYFEFLKPDDPKSVGRSDVAFGVNRAGDLDLLKKRAEAAGMKSEVQTITRAFKGKDVDWFRSLKRTDEKVPSIGLWTLEYLPTFLTEWNPTPGAKSSVRRQDVLRRYTEVVKQKAESKSMVDVTAIWLDMPEKGIDESLRECEVLGLTSRRMQSEATCSKGDELVIHLRPRSEPAFSAVQFALRSRQPKSEQQIGSTTLKIDGSTALWRFRE